MSIQRKSGINLEHFLKNKLRRASYQWPPRKEAIKSARIARGKYKCASCEGDNFGPKEIQLDHIEPVIDPHLGFVDWNSYIDRLFCTKEGFQVLCLLCHNTKTDRENSIRSEVKKDRKTTKKNKKKSKK